eukprot:SAG11_NODE_640_length_8012_cov_14.412486_8_plen_319_part_00
MRVLDCDRSGDVSYEELLAWWKHKTLAETVTALDAAEEGAPIVLHAPSAKPSYSERVTAVLQGASAGIGEELRRLRHVCVCTATALHSRCLQWRRRVQNAGIAWLLFDLGFRVRSVQNKNGTHPILHPYPPLATPHLAAHAHTHIQSPSSHSVQYNTMRALNRSANRHAQRQASTDRTTSIQSFDKGCIEAGHRRGRSRCALLALLRLSSSSCLAFYTPPCTLVRRHLVPCIISCSIAWRRFHDSLLITLGFSNIILYASQVCDITLTLAQACTWIAWPTEVSFILLTNLFLLTNLMDALYINIISSGSSISQPSSCI